MVQKFIALTLAVALFGAACPLFAGDEVDSKLLPPAPSRYRLAPAGLAFAPPSPQQSAAPTPQKRELTTTGKVLKWVGIGLMGEGAITVGVGAAVGASGVCGGTYQVDCGTARGVYFGIGGASIAAGAVLLVIGLHKRQ